MKPMYGRGRGRGGFRGRYVGVEDSGADMSPVGIEDSGAGRLGFRWIQGQVGRVEVYFRAGMSGRGRFRGRYVE